jgi:hypothetical protein
MDVTIVDVKCIGLIQEVCMEIYGKTLDEARTCLTSEKLEPWQRFHACI